MFRNNVYGRKKNTWSFKNFSFFENLKQVNSQIGLYLLPLPSPTPPVPKTTFPFLFLFLFLNHPVNTVSAAHTCMGVGQTSEHRESIDYNLQQEKQIILD